MLPISCIIIAKNEADRIGRTIDSVRELVSDVVVVDSGSTDGTQQIAIDRGARVIHNVWPGFGQQKRFAEEQAHFDWLINLDADEVVPPALAAEIRDVFAGVEPSFAGYWVDDHIIYPGRSRPRPLARDHRFVRLYDRRKMRFADSTLQDNVDPAGQPLGSLRHPLWHHSVRSFDDLIAKSDERAAYNAGHARRMSRAALNVRLVTEFPMQFLKYYFWRTHVFGGLAGFQYATIIAFFRFVRILRIREGAGRGTIEMNAAGVRSAAQGHSGQAATRSKSACRD